MSAEGSEKVGSVHTACGQSWCSLTVVAVKRHAQGAGAS